MDNNTLFAITIIAGFIFVGFCAWVSYKISKEQ